MTLLNNLFSPELNHALGWTILHSFWQTALVAIVLGILLVTLRKFSSMVRYVMSVSSMAVILVLGIVTFFHLYQPQEFAVHPTSPGLTTFEVVENLPALSTENQNIDNFDKFASVFKIYFSQHLPLVVSVWLLGVLLLTLRFLGGLAYIQRLRFYKTSVIPNEWHILLKDLCEKVKLKKSIQVMESAIVKVPIAIGYLKPVILLPIGTVTGFTPKQVEAIFAHELAHIMRNDYLINMLQSIVEIIFFYHPAVWWISSQVRTEREHCCDDIAITLSNDTLVYARTLADLQEMNLHAPGLALAVIGHDKKLFKRVKRIVKTQKSMPTFKEGFLAACILIGCMFITSIGSSAIFRNNKQEKEVETSRNVLTDENMEEEGNLIALYTENQVPLEQANEAEMKQNRRSAGKIRNNPMKSDSLQWLYDLLNEKSRNEKEIEFLESTAKALEQTIEVLHKQNIVNNNAIWQLEKALENTKVEIINKKHKLSITQAKIDNDSRVFSVKDEIERIEKKIKNKPSHDENKKGSEIHWVSSIENDDNVYAFASRAKYSDCRDCNSYYILFNKQNDPDLFLYNGRELSKGEFDKHKETIEHLKEMVIKHRSKGNKNLNHNRQGRFDFTESDKHYIVRFNDNGDISKLIINNNLIPPGEYYQYEQFIKEKVMEFAEHEEEMARHDQEMADHDIEMGQHEQDLAEHEIDLRQHEQELADHEIEMGLHEQEMVEHEIGMSEHDVELAEHEKEMIKHEIELAEHEEELKKHEKELARYEKNLAKLKKELIKDGFIGKDSKKCKIKITDENMFINDKKQSKKIFKKYKKLLKEMKEGRFEGEMEIRF